jgi:predicted MFS family arabinose efflux permease
MLRPNRAAPLELEHLSSSYRWYVVLLLSLANTIYAADRILLGVLVEPIKADFGASDSLMGLVNLLATTSYSVFVIPLGLLADRVSRRKLLAIILTCWSLMTAASGFVRDVVSLAAAQMLGAANESGGSTTMNSLIADLFERKRRGLPVALWYCGIPIGGFVGFSVAAYLAQEFGWRATFLIFGVPGLIIALLVWVTVRETRRGMADRHGQSAQASPNFRQTLQYLRSQTALRHAILAQCLSGMALMGPIYWLVAFFMRSHEVSLAQAGGVLGVIFCVTGICSNPGGGFLMDRLGRRDIRWPGWLCAILMLTGGAAMTGIYLAPTAFAAFAACSVWQLVTNAVSPINVTVVSNLAPAQYRAFSLALGFLLFQLMGFGAGAQIIGALSDWLAAGRGLGARDALRISCLTMVAFYPWAAFHFWMTARHSEQGYRNAVELECT